MILPQAKQTKLQVRPLQFGMEPMFAVVSNVNFIIENPSFEFYVKLGNRARNLHLDPFNMPQIFPNGIDYEWVIACCLEWV
jgi:hypothetical protein